MTITVDVRPEVQAELARQAASRGSAIEAYAASLLEEAVQVPAPRFARLFSKRPRRIGAKPKRSLIGSRWLR
jgi:hypothetical protein